jgi:hypothetical protein
MATCLGGGGTVQQVWDNYARALLLRSMVLGDNQGLHSCTATVNTVATGLAETLNARVGGLRAGLAPRGWL